MPQFLLLLHAEPTEWLKMPAEGKYAAFAKYKAWSDKAREGGYLVGGNKLTDDTGKVMRGPKPVTVDGPYSETKEVLGGYYIIEAANYDEAARRCFDHPQLAYGTIEIRQIEVMRPPT
jgi:hypothetical protein